MTKVSLECIHEEENEDENLKKNKKLSIKLIPDSIHRHFKRGISLPYLKLDPELEEKDDKNLRHAFSKREKDSFKKDRRPRKSSKEKMQDKEWEEVFFHYFEDILDRFLKTKQLKAIKRSRFRSKQLS